MRRSGSSEKWHQQETYGSLITYGLNAIKFVLVGNGAAILAVLTFVADHVDKIASLKFSLHWFIAGIAAGGITNVTAYLTQLSLFNERGQNVIWYEDHRVWLGASVIFIIAGYLCFAVGAISAVDALSAGNASGS